MPADFLPPSPEQIRRRRAGQFSTIIRQIALGQPAAANSNARLAFDGATKLSQIPKTRAGVPAIPLGPEADPGLAAYGSVSVAWLQSLRNSVFDKMLPSMQNVPMLTKVAITTSGFIASEVDQGIGIPLEPLLFAAPGALAPRKITVITASSEELLRSSEGEAIFTRELGRGVVVALDKSLVTDLLGENAAIGSSAALADIVSLLGAVKLSGESSPFFIMSPTRRAKAAGLVTSGVPVFPQIGVVGDGNILGVPVLSSDSVADSAIILTDAAAIFASGNSPLELEQSTEADVQMADIVTIASRTGSPPEPTPVNVVSMFQVGAKAIKATRYFSYRIGRANSVASVSGISW